jgi:GMP synthase-like glutamine amidotransferase
MSPRVHWFQHAEHEGLGCIEPWLRQREIPVRCTRGYAGDAFPRADDFDWLIVMGGPMNIYEHQEHPWLVPEKKVINDAIVMNKKILGICLGSQLLADQLGGPVTKNKCREIGWFNVEMTAYRPQLTTGFPKKFEAFHWHGDTFEIPPGCVNLGKSDACVNQAFSRETSILGLQFHLEVTYRDAQRWLELEDLVPEPYVQSNFEILADPSRFEMNNRLMESVLERMLAA